MQKIRYLNFKCVCLSVCNLHLYLSSKWALQSEMMPVLNDRVRIFPVRPLKDDSEAFKNTAQPVQLVASACSYVRVVDVEQPVEAHVDAQRHVDQVRVALLQPLVQAGEAGGQLGDVQQLLVLFEAVLLEDLARRWHAQQVHCRGEEESWG